MTGPPFGIARRLQAAPARVLATLKAAADRQYVKSVHLIVRDPTGRHGFALFGGRRHRHHLSRIYFGGFEHRLRLGWHRGNVDTAPARLVRQYGLAVFTAGSIPSALAPEALRVPLMVDFERPVPASFDGPEANWTSSAKADIARVKRAGFRCTIERNGAWIPTFLREFSKPSMASRHEAEAFHPTDRYLRGIIDTEGGEFIRVWRGESCVAAILNSHAPEGYRLRSLGWLNGDPAWPAQGVVAAMYWFSLRRAAELGYTRCLFGGAWPYLEDGLVFYKGKWGGRLHTGTQRWTDLHVLIDPAHDSCRQFLDTYSLVTRGAGDDYIVFSARTPAETGAPRSVVASVARWYRWRRPEETAPPVDHPEVPAHLRPWLVAETLPARG
jgi:hypothetical protein